jgi:hypothetical protein
MQIVFQSVDGAIVILLDDFIVEMIYIHGNYMLNYCTLAIFYKCLYKKRRQIFSKKKPSKKAKVLDKKANIPRLD